MTRVATQGGERPARGDEPSLHALAWAWWALCATVAVQLAASPAAAVVVLGVAWFVASTVPRRGQVVAAVPLVIGLAGFFVLLRALLTVLTTHGGSDVLFTLPSFTLPTLLGGFEVGGTVEQTVLLRSLAEGVVVLAVLAVFCAFNLVVAHAELLRALPRALHELGLAVSIALAFLPSLARAVTDVREADRARTGGRVVRRGRLVRTLVPLLEGALARALLLAESMDARGHGRGSGRRSGGPGRWVVPAGLGLLVVAFGLLVGRAGTAAAVAGFLGLVVVGVGVALVGRDDGRSAYRPRPLARADRLAMALAALGPLGVVAVGAAGLAASWDPAADAVPPLDVATAVALLALALPALVRPVPARGTRGPERSGEPAARSLAGR